MCVCIFMQLNKMKLHFTERNSYTKKYGVGGTANKCCVVTDHIE